MGSQPRESADPLPDREVTPMIVRPTHVPWALVLLPLLLATLAMTLPSSAHGVAACPASYDFEAGGRLDATHPAAAARALARGPVGADAGALMAMADSGGAAALERIPLRRAARLLGCIDNGFVAAGLVEVMRPASAARIFARHPRVGARTMDRMGDRSAARILRRMPRVSAAAVIGQMEDVNAAGALERVPPGQAANVLALVPELQEGILFWMSDPEAAAVAALLVVARPIRNPGAAPARRARRRGR